MAATGATWPRNIRIAAIVPVLTILLFVTDGAAQDFSCAPKKTCKQIRSCTEAVFRLRQCGDSRRDGDGDGIPCEDLCGKTLAQMNERLRAGL